MQRTLRSSILSLLVVCLVSIVYFPLMAQAQGTEVIEIDLGSPKRAVNTHRKFYSAIYMKSSNREKFMHYASLPLRHPQHPEARMSSMVEKARKLYDLFNATGLIIKDSKISDDPNYTDTLQHTNRYTLGKIGAVPIQLISYENQWYYTPETVNHIESLYNEYFLTEKGGIVRWLGIDLYTQEKYFGITLYQYFFLCIYFVLGIFIWILSFTLIKRGIKKVIQKLNFFLDSNSPYIPSLSKASAIMLSSLFWVLFLPLLELPAEGTYYFRLLFSMGMITGGMWGLLSIIEIATIYFGLLADKTESTLDNQLIPIVRKSLKITVIAIAVLFVFQMIGINTTGLLAGLSIGGIALALAAQDTIKNFFGSIMIFADRPFQVGDWIVADKIDGIVEEVGFRSTRVRTFYNSVTYVPNGKIADFVIDNMGVRTYRRFRTRLGVQYNTPVDTLGLFVEGIRKIVNAHPLVTQDKPPVVYFDEMGDFSLQIIINAHLNAKSPTEELGTRQEIFMKIMKWAEELGVQFAFPTQTLHIDTFPNTQGTKGTASIPPEQWAQRWESFQQKTPMQSPPNTDTTLP